MLSYWARWCLKASASRLFIQPFIQAQLKENIKAPRHWSLYGEFTGDRWIPPNHQRPVRRKRFPFDDVIMSARETDVLSDPCPAGFTNLTTGYRCYYYDYRHQLTWMDAVRFCESRGGLLLALATTDKFDRFIAWYRKSECCWRFSLILTNPFSRCVSVRHKLLIIICELYHECIND